MLLIKPLHKEYRQLITQLTVSGHLLLFTVLLTGSTPFGSSLCARSVFYYSSVMEPVGQVAAQVPQPRQASASISYLSSPSVIAPTGHSPAQAPHFTQPSLITNAIVKSSCLELMEPQPPHCIQCTSFPNGMQVIFCRLPRHAGIVRERDVDTAPGIGYNRVAMGAGYPGSAAHETNV